MQNETYKSFTELMKTARGNKAIGQCLCDIVDFQEILYDTPNADVIPVVRCCNCIHLKTNTSKKNYCDIHSTTWDKFYVRLDDYCSYGRKKEVKCK